MPMKRRKKRGCQYRLEDGSECGKTRVAMHEPTTQMLCRLHQHEASCCFPIERLVAV